MTDLINIHCIYFVLGIFNTFHLLKLLLLLTKKVRAKQFGNIVIVRRIMPGPEDQIEAETKFCHSRQSVETSVTVPSRRYARQEQTFTVQVLRRERIRWRRTTQALCIRQEILGRAC